MTTDITELAQSLKAAAEKATQGNWRAFKYHDGRCGIGGGHHDEIMVCEHISKRRPHDAEFIAMANPANILALVEALEKAQQRIVELQQGCENDPRIHEIIDLKERIDNLESFRTAYMEWGEKTDWVQTDKRFDVLKPWGKHRADVLKEYIQHLESRTVTVKLPDLRQIVSGDRYAWSDGVYNYSQDVKVALAAAGIKVEAE
ncbi:ead/Ea22-like family protein [Klebsiella michiganensis]|uniref:ead/Ea22-like family protein n=1 Tax=Klebsiella michiganensis TaxID=1134687 RepID=UPI00287C47E6|nr:ead/Ea22-like family protein [Klebsiella michiganensis]MDS7767324.1 ead/Ea22-like family protein [Klebsiella michiganensis]MDS7823891.1 ead/Ea22-like family protein [Klebsiella michiganensis]MDS7834981.1 ead/Ea22-like family protein [Klebsiella michiganensis]